MGGRDYSANLGCFEGAKTQMSCEAKANEDNELLGTLHAAPTRHRSLSGRLCGLRTSEPNARAARLGGSCRGRRAACAAWRSAPSPSTACAPTPTPSPTRSFPSPCPAPRPSLTARCSPVRPEEVDWRSHFPRLAPGRDATPQIADVGCGFGGLLCALSATLPSHTIVGLEIRAKAAEFVRDRIAELQQKHEGQYTNIACLRCNAMKHLPNHFKKGQLSKIFFTFPDPHFKKSNHRRRIISPTLLAEYAYVLQEGGLAYTITDVKELHEWMVAHLAAHPLFVRVTDQARLAADPCVALIATATEESKKVEAHGGSKYIAVFERAPNPPPLH